MKVSKRVVRRPGQYARVMLALSISMALMMSALAPVAGAITRDEVINRGTKWVKKRVKYSQSGYYKGYRRDCSGFVSMAWGLKKSYTTKSISKKATRIKVSSLKPGDAVLKPGHISIFAGWKNKRKRTYYALEQTTWGSHAKKSVKKIPRRAKALRLKGIKDATPVAAVPAPVPSAAVAAPAVTSLP